MCSAPHSDHDDTHTYSLIARNSHRLRDMGLGTSRHEDDQLPCRRSRMICGRPRAACWDRKERRAVWENSCSQVQVDFDDAHFMKFYFCAFLFAWHFDAQSVQLSLSPRGFASKYEETKRAGRLFVVDSTRAWPPHRIAGVEGVRLACRLQVE